ncbi:hypothetical protein [Hydrogenimonas thermophila]|uniref:Uncharacterized protein n=1 Tax=Hydrogenimonas thermophila TaxID=223786 RepID=A0A1I5UU72_9BACT|nr:hypothetical protein [Hydrogenimonas thermophila]WOE71039.1 hypothetical protein RZR91_05560 [Hydrogenimonas thermophila]WOE73557.1 hypothetical protein RZR97_05540 [Hydrogenimonas thermophila]SFP98738.1 hypothetical protein SAMN05216234_1714 [Hydrogenimonas thermophila]
MKTAIGFKGRYFTLAAIQALNSAIKLQAKNSTFISVAVVYNALSDIQEDDDDPPDSTSCLCQDSLKQNSSKPCHCNCYFRRLAWLLLNLSKLFRRTLCRCRKTKTGLAPPVPF